MPAFSFTSEITKNNADASLHSSDISFSFISKLRLSTERLAGKEVGLDHPNKIQATGT